MLFSITYISQTKNLMSQEDLGALLNQSKSWNTEHGITGLLVYIQGNYANHAEGRFIQVIEGTKDVVESLFYNKISPNDQHYNVNLLKQENIETRNFSDWQMGYESIDLEQDPELYEFFNLNEDVLKLEAFHQSNALIDFLKAVPVFVPELIKI